MQIRLERSDLEFLARLARLPEWTVLAEIISREQAAHDEKLRVLAPTEVARHQGISSWLVNFKATVEGAALQLARTTRDSRSSLPAVGQGIRPPSEKRRPSSTQFGTR